MILEQNTKIKRNFNPANKKDIECYRDFILNKGWGNGTCPFILEYPFHSIPEMINDKLMRHFLKIEKRD